jgi:hypothetical protein
MIRRTRWLIRRNEAAQASACGNDDFSGIVHLTEDSRKSGRDAALQRPRPYSVRNEISKNERFFPTDCAAECGADSAARCPISVNLTWIASLKSLGKCTFLSGFAERRVAQISEISSKTL